MIEETKKCGGCNQTKSFSEFYRNKAKKDGLGTQCKFCMAERREKNRGAAKKYAAEYRGKHLDQVKEWNSKYYAENREAILEMDRKYRRENSHRVAANNGKMSAILRSPLGWRCIPDDFDIGETMGIYQRRDELTASTGIPHHVDHIIPVKAGGMHCASNLQVLPIHEHHKKRPFDTAMLDAFKAMCEIKL